MKSGGLHTVTFSQKRSLTAAFNLASSEIKNVFDNMISKGQIKPLIVVSATFYNANSGSDFGSSVRV
jgi:hypothetical protein